MGEKRELGGWTKGWEHGGVLLRTGTGTGRYLRFRAK